MDTPIPFPSFPFSVTKWGCYQIHRETLVTHNRLVMLSHHLDFLYAGLKIFGDGPSFPGPRKLLTSIDVWEKKWMFSMFSPQNRWKPPWVFTHPAARALESGSLITCVLLKLALQEKLGFQHHPIPIGYPKPRIFCLPFFWYSHHHQLVHDIISLPVVPHKAVAEVSI